MDDNTISYLALLTSVVSLVVSFLTLYRDRHAVTARAVPFQQTDGTYSLHVTVANHGKRPIMVTHVLLKRPGDSGLSLNFEPNEGNKIDVGESRSCAISSKGLPTSWSSSEELRSMEVSVIDALGKKHRAKWVGT
jgi:hypothetical protein